MRVCLTQSCTHHQFPTNRTRGIPRPWNHAQLGLPRALRLVTCVPTPFRPSGGLHLKMAINNLLLLSSILATVPALPPPQPTTTTEASVKSRTNGLINDVKEINLFLNIPKGCDIVYDGLIKQLEGCRSGSNHGDPRLTSGCLLKLLLLLLLLLFLLLLLLFSLSLPLPPSLLSLYV